MYTHASMLPTPTQQSQTLKALLGLRALIVDGELKASERVSEQMVVGRLAVSRTPARAALARLAEEGFLKPLHAGGYVVAAFSEKDVLDAIDIRGTLEGM